MCCDCLCCAVLVLQSLRCNACVLLFHVPWKDALLQAAEAKAKEATRAAGDGSPNAEPDDADDDALECAAEDGEEEVAETDEVQDD